MSSATHGPSSDPFLRKLRAARKLLDQAEIALRRAEAAARPIYYLDLHRTTPSKTEQVLPLRIAG
jgi:hypothetical protein